MPLIIPGYAPVTHPAQSNWDVNDVIGFGLTEIGTGVVTGCLVTPTTGMKVKTSAGNAAFSAVEFAVAAATTLTIAAATTHDRKDIIVVNTAGTVSVVKGTACTVATWNATSNATPPEEPAVPATSVRLGSVYVVGTANGHGTTTVASTNITDKTALILTSPGGVPSVPALLPAVTRRTTAALPAGTYTNGPTNNGIGATFTVTATGVLSIDGANPPVGARIAVTQQATPIQNGIYVVTVAGAVGVHAKLIRATTANTSGKLRRVLAVHVKLGSLTAGGMVAFSPAIKTFVIGTNNVTAVVAPTVGSSAFPGGIVATILQLKTRIIGSIPATAGSIVVRPNGTGTPLGQVRFLSSGVVVPSNGTGVSGGFSTKTTATIRTPITASSGVAFQPTATNDVEIFFGFTLAGTVTISYAATSAGTANSLLSSFAVVAGSTFTKRIPASWYVKITLTTATITTVKIQTV